MKFVINLEKSETDLRNFDKYNMSIVQTEWIGLDKKYTFTFIDQKNSLMIAEEKLQEFFNDFIEELNRLSD